VGQKPSPISTITDHECSASLSHLASIWTNFGDYLEEPYIFIYTSADVTRLPSILLVQKENA